MSTNKEYAKKLMEMEGYERPIIAFKLCDEVPEHVEPYGDEVSFFCAMVKEVWEGGNLSMLPIKISCVQEPSILALETEELPKRILIWVWR